MAEETQSQSIQARIAALNLGHVGRAPITANGGKPEAPYRPLLEERSQSTSNVPETSLDGIARIGNEPNGARKNGLLPPPANIIRTGQQELEQKPTKSAPPPPPRLPMRKPSTQISPALPPRRPSDQLTRTGSNESVSSTIHTTLTSHDGTIRDQNSRSSSIDIGPRMKAPIYDPSTLPPLPPKRAKTEMDKRYHNRSGSMQKSPERSRPVSRSRLSIDRVEANPTSPPVPTLPPRRPSKPEPTTLERKLPPGPDQTVTNPARSALSFGLNKSSLETPVNGANDHASAASSQHGQDEDTSHAPESHRHYSPTPRSDAGKAPSTGTPPPIPRSSRPDLSKIQSTKPKVNGTSAVPPKQSQPRSNCLLCRDFSAPDNHAAKFPRQSVPSLDWLASQLTAPFSNSPTDQARCIFTWLHHNIAYDTVSFFNNNVRPSTPASTLSTGLAVCEGYAGLFTAIASKAGLESVVVSGHGKGYSFAPLKPNDPIPAEYSTHAWNAVKIDSGEWKLIDSCWGAGHVNGKNQPYTKHFSPRMFTMSNEEFGSRHFPTNRNHFFRFDSRKLTWEEYILGDAATIGDESLQIYSGVAENEGISEQSLSPRGLHIRVSSSASSRSAGAPISLPSPQQQQKVRFSFSRVCPHWSPVRNGKGGSDYVFILAVHGANGYGPDDYLPFETDTGRGGSSDAGGGNWWLDVDAKTLGSPGQTISCFAVDTVDGKNARGLGVDGYRKAKGRKAMTFAGVAAWQLV